VFLQQHPKLQAYLIYSDEKGNYQVYETSGIKSIVSEIAE
jgi:FAD:protein FMN transferase